VNTRIIIIVGLVVLGVATAGFVFYRTAGARVGPMHIYELSEQPKFLTEDLAIAKARDTLKADGLNPAAWQPFPYGQTKSPDGRTDEFFSRNTNTINEGSIVFTNSSATMRIVRVQLEGSRVVCQNWILKD
jgi:hypothetical protein